MDNDTAHLHKSGHYSRERRLGMAWMPGTEGSVCYIRLMMEGRHGGTRAVGSDRLFGLALWVIGAAPATVFLDRALYHPFASPPSDGWGTPRAWEYVNPGRSGLAALGTAALVTLVLARCAHGRPGIGGSPGAGVLAAAFGLYAAPLVSALLTGHGGFGDWWLWLPMALLALLVCAPSYGLAGFLPRVRRVLRVYTWGSLLSLFLIRERVTEANGNGVLNIGWLDGERLGGIAGHPILLAMLAGVALVIEVTPIGRARLWPLHAAMAVAALGLSQSRTGWGAALLGLLLLYCPDRRPALLSRALALSSLPVLGTGLLLLTPGAVDSATSALTSDEVATLHGRTVPWEIGLRAFGQSPLTGWGPRFYHDVGSLSGGAFSHGHSQLIHTLATAGLLGAAALLCFLAIVLRAAHRARRDSCGLTMALSVMTLVFCVTEVPLRSDGLSPNVLLAFLLITVVTITRRGTAELPAPRTQEPALPAASCPVGRT